MGPPPTVRVRAAALLLVVAPLAVACTDDDGRSSPTTSVPTSPPVVSTTAPAPATTAPAPVTAPATAPVPGVADVFAMHRYRDRMPATWEEPVVIPYGDGDDQLGTSIGGDGEGIRWGPSYGAVAADGTWWILDAAKFRFAHYDAAGGFLGAVEIPPAHLADGRYVQWQHPLALADGTIVCFRLTGADGTVLLVLRDGRFSEVTLDRQVVVKTDDGVALYGFGPGNELLAVDVATATVTEVDAFRTRAGTRYRLSRDASSLRFAFPDLGVEHEWATVAADTGAPASGAIAAVSTTGGELHVFVDGAAAGDEATGLSGYGVIDGDGELRPTEATRQPWSASDDGSGSRLVARPGSDDVWFIAIDTDAVRLYRRL
ncbi:MAG TPA: hypothetical protein VIS05_05000 [Ilumatobacter sp.]